MSEKNGIENTAVNFSRTLDLFCRILFFRKKYCGLIFPFVFSLLISCGPESVCGKRAKNNAHTEAAATYYSANELKIIHRLDSIFTCRVKENNFNGCVLIAQGEKIIYKRAMGFLDYKNKIPLNIHSSFQIASSSKPFTATAVLLLMEQGKLSLDDSVQKFIPGFPYKGITVKHLLCHRSGLPNYMYFVANYFENNEKFITNGDIVNCMIGARPEKYSPSDKKFEYCNTNYCLLAYIIEKISGKKYKDFMKENIFDPLNMKNTFVIDRNYDTVPPNCTRGYQGKKWKPAEVNVLDGINGDKNIYSSVYDLFVFDRALYRGKLLKPETIEAAYKGYSHEHPGKRNYGLGWRLIDRSKSCKIVYHNGWWHGYNSLFFRRPADKTLITVLCNHYNRITYHTRDILEILDNDNTPAILEKEE